MSGNGHLIYSERLSPCSCQHNYSQGMLERKAMMLVWEQNRLEGDIAV